MKYSAYVLLAVFSLIYPSSLSLMEIGGEIRTSAGIICTESEMKASLSGLAEIELFFSSPESVEPRLVFQAELADENIKPGIKYMYLRPRGEWGHFTIGRQPVFWSYGAMLNLMDYGLGVDDLAGETLRTGIDGLRYHRLIGDGRSIQFVASFPERTNVKFDHMGFGSRLRIPGKGRDISFNFLYQPLDPVSEGVFSDSLLRAGATWSFDAGPFGLYGSGGYFRLSDSGESDLLAQLGVDTSWRAGGGRYVVVLQAEYYRFVEEKMNASVLAGLQLGGGSIERGAQEAGAFGILGGNDLFLANIYFQPDFFTSAGTLLFIETENETGGIAPYYITELGGNVELRFDSSLMLDGGEDIHFGLTTSLYYYF